MFCSLSLLCRVVKCGSVGWSSVGVWEGSSEWKKAHKWAAQDKAF